MPVNWVLKITTGLKPSTLMAKTLFTRAVVSRKARSMGHDHDVPRPGSGLLERISGSSGGRDSAADP